MNITILLPTKNRFYYLDRLLDYYKLVRFKGKLIILDSSDQNIRAKIKYKISLLKSLDIKYFHSKGLPCGLMKKYYKFINTKYVVFSGDDDYFTLSGLKKCLKFLDNNKNYIGCNGVGLSFISNFKSNYVDFIDLYKQAEIFGNNARERLKFQFNNYRVPIFSVFRTNDFKNFLHPVATVEETFNKCPDKIISDEYIIETSMVANGNIRKLNFPYLVRHIHNNRNADNLVIISPKKWIKSHNFKKSLNFFLRQIASQISKIDKIQIDKAKKFLKINFNLHLKKILDKEEKSSKNNLKKFFSKFIYLRRIRYFIKKYFSYNVNYLQIVKNKELRNILKSIESYSEKN
jgi:glycosyltransferase domain-containing protein